MSAYTVTVMRYDEDMSTRYIDGGLCSRCICGCEESAHAAVQAQIEIYEAYGFFFEIVDGVHIADDGDVKLHIWVERESD